MHPKQDDLVSRPIIRAVLESRDHRHNETHAVMLGMFQSLVAELVEQGVLAPAPLADRLTRMSSSVASGPNGAAGADMIDHVLAWLRSIQPDLPPPHPGRWFAPPLVPDVPVSHEGESAAQPTA